MKKYLDFETVVKMFSESEYIWYELPDGEITQEMIDSEPEQFDGYIEGDILSSTVSLSHGNTIEDLDPDNKYFETI